MEIGKLKRTGVMEPAVIPVPIRREQPVERPEAPPKPTVPEKREEEVPV